MFNKDTHLFPKIFCAAFAGGTKNTIGVAVACAIAEIMIGIVTFTGLKQEMFNVLMQVANTGRPSCPFPHDDCPHHSRNRLPTTANYLIMEIISVPIVINMASLYLQRICLCSFGIVANIILLVALAAYADSAIVHSNPFKTALQ